MPSLREAQKSLAAVFTHPGGVEPGLAAAGFGGRRPVTALVADQPPVPLHTRLAVYSDAYFLRLLDALGQDFAAVKRAAGAAAFQALIAAYLARRPSRSPLINDLGEDLPAFLKKHPLSKAMPFLSELAALEWSVLRTLFTDRLPPAAPGAFAGMGPGARLRLDPTVRLLKTRWAVDRLWEARGLPEGKGVRRLGAPSPRRLLLYRGDGWARVRALDEAEFTALEKLAAGKTLERSLEGLGKGLGPRRVRGWFERWTRDGIVKGLL